MWTKARCLAALDARLADAFTVEAAFRKPILLPATVEFVEDAAPAPASGSSSASDPSWSSDSPPGEIRFGVRDAIKRAPHLDGRVTPS